LHNEPDRPESTGARCGAVMGRQMAITSAVIAGLLLLFSGYARAMARRGVLR